MAKLQPYRPEPPFEARKSRQFFTLTNLLVARVGEEVEARNTAQPHVKWTESTVIEDVLRGAWGLPVAEVEALS